jgi:hypothetical protein
MHSIVESLEASKNGAYASPNAEVDSPLHDRRERLSCSTPPCESPTEHDPRGSVVASVLLSAGPSVYAPIDQSLANDGREKKMIQAHLSQSVRLFRRLLMLLMLKVAIFTGPASLVT